MPSKVPEGGTRGWIVTIGGAENKENDRRILSRFVAVSGGTSADIVVIPIVDVDSVERGQGGKKQQPHDQNEDWGPAPYFPEVRAGMEKLASLARADRLDLFLDLHNPGAGNHSIMFYIPPVPLLLPERVTNEDKFLNIVREQMTGPIPYVESIFPFGGQRGRSVDVALSGRNLDGTTKLTLALAPRAPRSQEIRVKTPRGHSNLLPFTISEVNGNLVLRYPSWASAFALESATSVPSAVWTSVTNTVLEAGGVLEVTVLRTGAQQFYRLRSP